MKKGTMNAESRKAAGKGASGRLRNEGKIPGVVYGAGGEPVSVSVLERDVQAALKTGVRILDLKVGAESVTALLKDVDYDHLGERLIHVDFQRLRKGEKISIRVPLVFKGVPAGAKEGGVFNIVHDAIGVSCLPEDVPDHVEIEVSGLQLGDSLHVKEVPLPKGVEASEGGDFVLAVVTYSDKEVEAVAAVPEEAATQPEVIGEAERKAREEAKAAETAGGAGGKKADAAGAKPAEKGGEKKG
jgi:large subunit ribosomal protein L25